jgi:hypothetical protein
VSKTHTVGDDSESPRRTHFKKFSMVIPHSAGMSAQGMVPSLSHHQAQVEIVLGAGGNTGLSPRSLKCWLSLA